MVQLEEVQDEEYIHTGEKVYGEDDDDDFTDTESEISEADEYDLDAATESLADRIYALKDMIPPTARRRLVSGFESTVSWTKAGLWLGGKAAFVLSTSALLIGVPLAMAIGEEAQAMEIEKEQKMREMGNEMLGGGSQNAGQGVAQGQAKAAL